VANERKGDQCLACVCATTASAEYLGGMTHTQKNTTRGSKHSLLSAMCQLGPLGVGRCAFGSQEEWWWCSTYTAWFTSLIRTREGRVVAYWWVSHRTIPSMVGGVMVNAGRRLCLTHLWFCPWRRGELCRSRFKTEEGAPPSRADQHIFHPLLL
jgi:hypothetical protein